MEKHINMSRFLSLVLRHKPETIGLKLDEYGYINVEELIKGVEDSGRSLDKTVLEEIVESDSKNRYSFSKDGAKIRANQGHSIKVDLGLKEVEPERSLYHGTATRFQGSINKKGLVKGSREYVHLSEDLDTAEEVGKRRGKPIIYKVDTERMVEEGYVFYKSKNNVWLTESVPAEYLTELKY